MPEAQGGAAASAEAPVTQTEGQTSESEQTTETGAVENEQGHTEETPEKKVSRFQRRLERQKTARIAAETEARLLRDRVAALEGRRESSASTEKGEPKREDFDSYEAFVEARAEYRAEKRASEVIEKRFRERDEAKTKEEGAAEQRRVEASWSQSLEAAREKYTDFDEVTVESEAPTTPTMTRAIMESEVGADLVYYFANHPEEAERIAGLSPVRQIAELGKLEDKVLTKPAPKKPSSAPDPIKPVDGKSAGVEKDPDKMTDAEFAAWRRGHKKRR